MVENIFRKISTEKEIFRDERVLMPDYLPEVMPHREEQIKEIAYALRGAADGKKSENVLILGASGTGKTSSVRYVLKQLQEYSQRVVPIYVNCWESSTRHSILNGIAYALGEFVPRRGISTDEITDKIGEVLKKEKKTPVIALDEVDRLFASQYGEEKVLYDLARGKELFSVDFGIVAITNNREFLAKLDQRIKSSLVQKQLVFKQYSPIELKDILKSRAKLAFFPESLSEEVIPLCAARAAKNNGDARLAINILWKAGKIAERENAEKVAEEHVRKAFEEVGEGENSSEKLNGREREVYEFIQEKGEVTSSELYEKFKEDSDRSVRNYIDRLCSLGFVSAEDAKGNIGKRGRTRIIKIKK
ncbi:MAG: archaeal cell division control protein Cdc6 [Candidatus Fermentimicrarchaeum limneticum]|uniref:ORC1-type DNA replication protein n=1 Tax=Fermentimicrarchaeum limneticum TaxID=2795018 RepID=A0A7D5XFN7_FERL1|nr:MAG: archaeal cell division control protein Cdc6 [Candidatus Fermentimicrarchaeum limneticum]